MNHYTKDEIKDRLKVPFTNNDRTALFTFNFTDEYEGQLEILQIATDKSIFAKIVIREYEDKNLVDVTPIDGWILVDVKTKEYMNFPLELDVLTDYLKSKLIIGKTSNIPNVEN